MTSPGRALVTGAAGFIGSRLVERLGELGVPTMGWTRALGDLHDIDVVAREVAAWNPAVVFHLAALPGATKDGGFEVAAGEVAMVDNLIRAIAPTARLVHTGSMAEYGYSGTFDEDAPRRPHSPYGFAKAASVDRAVSLSVALDRQVRVARLFGVYGPGESEQRLIPHLVRGLSSGREVPLSDGTQVRDFVHVDDVCDALLALGEADVPPGWVVNVGTGVGVSVRRLALALCEKLGADPELLGFGMVPRRAVDEDVLVADVTRLARTGVLPSRNVLDLHGVPSSGGRFR